ncbi:MAG: HAD family hydrolase [Candidatus Bathyarchaeota archaeon]|nr:HAD family hydrolase [Candidatus Bathyarchaeota archaeon]
MVQSQIPSHLQSTVHASIEAVLFDLSGTLLNDLPTVYRGFVDLRKTRKKNPPSLNQFRKEFKLPYTEFLEEKGFANIDDAISFWKARYSSYGDSIRLFGDVKPALKMLKTHRGIKLGAVSQTPKDKVEENLNRFQIRDFFDAIVFDNWKPKPNGLMLALEGLNIAPRMNVIYVGDMREDCQAARLAGITPWVIYREKGSFHDLDTLRKASPARIIKSLAELNSLF